MCLLCIRMAGAFEPEWPDMNPAAGRGAATPRSALFYADPVSASPAPGARAATEPPEARSKS
jgi:hypothetical protein